MDFGELYFWMVRLHQWPKNKKYEFWQRDRCSINLFPKEMAFQKLDYLHYNTTSDKWRDVKEPVDYFYSSAKFYETGINDL